MSKRKLPGVVLEIVREILAAGQPALFTVRGDSMLPTLKDGEQVRVVPANSSDLWPGDLAAYVDAGGQIITHRVVTVERKAIITKGDNREQIDPPVPLDCVLGKVEAPVSTQTTAGQRCG